VCQSEHPEGCGLYPLSVPKRFFYTAGRQTERKNVSRQEYILTAVASEVSETKMRLFANEFKGLVWKRNNVSGPDVV
jgi:hypothetical protein